MFVWFVGFVDESDCACGAHRAEARAPVFSLAQTRKVPFSARL